MKYRSYQIAIYQVVPRFGRRWAFSLNGVRERERFISVEVAEQVAKMKADDLIAAHAEKLLAIIPVR